MCLEALDWQASLKTRHVAVEKIDEMITQKSGSNPMC